MAVVFIQIRLTTGFAGLRLMATPAAAKPSMQVRVGA
jgi:hypothetical protein